MQTLSQDIIEEVVNLAVEETQKVPQMHDRVCEGILAYHLSKFGDVGFSYADLMKMKDAVKEKIKNRGNGGKNGNSI